MATHEIETINEGKLVCRCGQTFLDLDPSGWADAELGIPEVTRDDLRRATLAVHSRNGGAVAFEELSRELLDGLTHGSPPTADAHALKATDGSYLECACGKLLPNAGLFRSMAQPAQVRVAQRYSQDEYARAMFAAHRRDPEHPVKVDAFLDELQRGLGAGSLPQAVDTTVAARASAEGPRWIPLSEYDKKEYPVGPAQAKCPNGHEMEVPKALLKRTRDALRANTRLQKGARLTATGASMTLGFASRESSANLRLNRLEADRTKVLQGIACPACGSHDLTVLLP